MTDGASWLCCQQEAEKKEKKKRQRERKAKGSAKKTPAAKVSECPVRLRVGQLPWPACLDALATAGASSMHLVNMQLAVRCDIAFALVPCRA